VAVAASFALVNASSDAPGAGFAADLYAPLAIAPTLLLGTLALRCYGLRTHFGRAILLATAGTVVWALADLYYTVDDVMQFASLADFGYVLGPALWGAALVVLWRAAGVTVRAALAQHGWFLLATAAVLIALAIPAGGDMLRLHEVNTADAALSIAYLVVDALLLFGAYVLHRGSFGFAPYRLVVLASATLCAADLLYTDRFVQGTYDPAADPSDLLYAAAIGLLMFALASFAAQGRAEHRRRSALLRMVRQQPPRTTAGGLEGAR
jgi:hypothetical protein